MSLASFLFLAGQIHDLYILFGVSIMVGVGSVSILDVVVAGVRAKIGAVK